MADLDLTKVPNLEGRKRAAELWKAYDEAYNAHRDLHRRLIEELTNGPELSESRAKMDAAHDAYFADDVPGIIEGETCALSGLPLLEDDDLLEDEVTGEKVLRCLVLPPRHETEDTGDEDEPEDDEPADADFSTEQV